MRPTTATNQIPALKFTIRMSHLLGVFEKKRSLRGYFAVFSVAFLGFEILFDGIWNWDGVNTLSKLIYLPSIMLTSSKGACQIIKSEEIINLVGMIRHFWHADDFDNETKEKVNKVFNLLTRIVQFYAGSIILFCICIMPLPILDKEHKTLIFTDFAFCNMQQFICWLSNYLGQCLMCVFQGIPSAIGFDLYFIIFTGYIYTSCQLLQAGLQRLNSDNPILRKYMLKEIVDQHKLIMEFVSSLNRLSSKVMFLQFSLTLWSLVLCCYMIVASGGPPSFDVITYFGAMFMIFSNQIFLYAYSGAIIEEEIKKISDSIFAVEWFGKGRTGLRKDLALMIQRAQNTKPLNAGKMSNLNLELFVATMKNALSIVMLIMQFENQVEHEHIPGS